MGAMAAAGGDGEAQWHRGEVGLPPPVGFDPTDEETTVDDVVLPEGGDFDFGVPDDTHALEEPEVRLETAMSNVVVVDHLPVVPQEKHEKLTAVLTKIFGQLGNIRENGLHMPSDASNNSKGFAFVEYNTPAEAVNARENANGYRLDKNHVFSVYTFDDLDKFSRVPNEYVPPEAKAYTPTEDLFHWLMDKRGRDQFASRYADQTEIFWNDAKATGKEELVYQRQHWTESFVQWSPRGTYLATVHRQGAALWGGPNFVRMQRFAHQHTRLIDFSPNERYIVCFSLQEPTDPRESAQAHLGFFDVRSGRKMRTFSGPAEDYGTSASSGVTSWPVFRWSGGPNDRFFAKLGKGAVSVYETPDFGMHMKKSYKAEAVSDFRWPMDSARRRPARGVTSRGRAEGGARAAQ